MMSLNGELPPEQADHEPRLANTFRGVTGYGGTFGIPVDETWLFYFF